MRIEEKKEVVSALSVRFEGVRGLVLADFTGLSVEAATEFRRRCREADTKYLVVKNRLARLAVQATELESISEHLKGPTGIVFATGNPLEPAKIVTTFEKEHGRPKLRAGWIEGALVDKEQIMRLAQLPSRSELLAQAAAGIAAPLTGFVWTLSALLQGLVTALDGIAKQKEEG